MRLFLNECYKLLTAPVFIAVTAIALLFTLYTSVGAEPIRISDEEYREFCSEISSLHDIDKQVGYIQELLEQERQSENRDLQWRAHIDFYTAESEQAMSVRDYQDYLTNIRNSAENMTGISIFAHKNSFAYRNALRIPELYEKVSGVRPNYINSEGVLVALNNRTIDILMILVLFSSVFILIGKERETGIFAVIKPLKKGRLPLCCTKLLVVFVVAVVSGILLFAESILIGSIRYGLTDFSSSIQSLKGYIGCDLPISILQAVIMIVAFKVITAFLLAMLLYLFCTRISTVSSLMLTTAFMALEYALYVKIPFTSKLSPLSAINLISFLNSADIFKTYRSINAFGHPIGYIYVTLSSLLIGIVISFAAANRLFASMKISVKTKKRTENNFERYIPKQAFSYTIYKFFFLHKGIAILLIVSLIQLYSAVTVKAPYDIDDRWYKYYCDTLAELNESEADNFIAAEAQRFEALRLELASGEASDYKMIQIGNELRASIGFNQAKEQFYYIKDVSSGNKAMFYLTGWNELFGVNGYQTDMNNSLILMLSMCLSILPVIAYDRKRNIRYIINATGSGRNVYYRHNIVFAAMLSVLLSLISFIPDFFAVISVYGNDGIINSIRCLPLFEKYADIPIWSYFLIITSVRAVTAAVISCIMIFISSLSSSTVSSLMIGITVFALPILVYLAGFAPALSFCSPLSCNHEWIDMSMGVFMNIAVFFASGIFSLFMLKRKCT